MTKNAKAYKKFWKKYSLILDDKYLSELRKNHFDKNGAFVGFLLAFLDNQINNKKLFSQFKVNKDEWCELLCEIYKDPEPIKLFKKLEINPIVPLEQTIDEFSCFDAFINHFIKFVKMHQLNLNIDENNVKQLIKNAFGYILYNCIECIVPYKLDNILVDQDYETKVLMAINNTKLFSFAKQSILENCQDKINNLIVLLLSMSNKLNYDK